MSSSQVRSDAERSPVTIKIREAAGRDLPKVLEIEKLAFPQPWSLESFKRELLLPFSRIIVAVDGAGDSGGQLAGFLCRWLIADECHILNVAVHPEHRRHGIAHLLMERTIGEAKTKDIQIVTLEVRRSNFAARGLYRKLRFEERRLRHNYYGPGEDAIVMELLLAAGS
jgi:[ribosomal protein S18]-alanine N-acetyltransferase